MEHQAQTATKTAPQGEPRLHSYTPVDPGVSIATHRGMAGLCLLAILLKSLIFAPLNIWPFAYVCLVPWLIAVGGSVLAPRSYLYSYLFGLVFFLINMRWLIIPTPPGYVILSLYLAAYFPLMACPLRHLVRRRRFPLAIGFPLIWTGCELLRAVVISGFPWFFLSHGLHKALPLIQISDLVGAYGVSFVAAAVNGLIADLIFARAAHRSGRESPVPKRRIIRGAVAVALLFVGSLVYGLIALNRDTLSAGPKVAVVQGDFPDTVDGVDTPAFERATIYMEMIDAAAAEKPDMIVLPESPWPMYLNPEARDLYDLARSSYRAFQSRAKEYNAVIITGSGTFEHHPFDLLSAEHRYNSAYAFHPDGREPDRYDKVHLVYFGEIVPFRFGKLRFLYFWINRIMPFSQGGTVEYSVFRGDGFHRFSFDAPSLDGKEIRFGIPICYEDVMPYVSREFVAGGNEKGVDVLLNISNDGWFGRGIQQPQHFAIAVYRAIENRVGIARAVNTGVSGFIQPTGRFEGIVSGSDGTPWPDDCGYSVATLQTDSRFTFYSKYGDWFGWMCALAWGVLFVDYWIARAREAVNE